MLGGLNRLCSKLCSVITPDLYKKKPTKNLRKTYVFRQPTKKNTKFWIFFRRLPVVGWRSAHPLPTYEKPTKLASVTKGRVVVTTWNSPHTTHTPPTVTPKNVRFCFMLFVITRCPAAVVYEKKLPKRLPKRLPFLKRLHFFWKTRLRRTQKM